MVYNVFGGSLNLAQSIKPSTRVKCGAAFTFYRAACNADAD